MTDKEIIRAQRICFRDLDDGAACPNCPLYGNENCLAEVMGGAADLLEWLSGASADLRKEIEWKDKVIALAQRKQAKAEAERDALIEQIKERHDCLDCKHNDSCEYDGAIVSGCMNCVQEGCPCAGCCDCSRWEWRGLPEAPEGGE